MSATINGDYITYRWPHPMIRRFIRDRTKEAFSKWPHWYDCDPRACQYVRGAHKHNSLWMALRDIWRWLFRGYTEYRWD